MSDWRPYFFFAVAVIVLTMGKVYAHRGNVAMTVYCMAIWLGLIAISLKIFPA